LAALTAALLSFYKLGENESKAWYQSELARINAESAVFKQQSEDSINGIETKRIQDQVIAESRIKQLKKQLQKPAITSCSTDSAGVIRADVSDSVVSLLSEAVNDPRIPEAIDPSGFVGTSETVTADTIAAYSFYSIGQYNQLAARYNALVEMVK
jgi:hypothetical protein